MKPSEVFEILCQMNSEGRTGSFIQSILPKYNTVGWSPRMLVCAEENAQRELARRQQIERATRQAERRHDALRASPTPFQLEPIRLMLRGARAAGKKYPYVLMKCEGRDYKVSLTSEQASKPNQITINDITYEKQWIGYILDGKINFRVPVSDAFIEALKQLALNPAASAAAYARATRSEKDKDGQCMFCSKGLRVMPEYNYGPDCGPKHGLPFDMVEYRRRCKMTV